MEQSFFYSIRSLLCTGILRGSINMKSTYIKTALQSLVNISKIVTIHYYEFDKNFVFNGERHDFWEMVYIDTGRVQVRRDDEELTLSQGEIIFHRPNEFHSIRALDSSPNFFVVSFVCNSPAMAYFEKYQTHLDKTLKPFISSVIREAESTFVIPKNDPHLKRLEKKEDASIGGEQLIKSYLEELLIHLMRNATQKSEANLFPSKESMESHFVLKAKSFIEENTEKPFRVNDLCAILGCSKSYLSRLFREQTGYTLASYSVKCKIKRAKELIREDNLNFSQISDALSFDNPQYFSRVFKRVTRMTPTEFKASLNFNR